MKRKKLDFSEAMQDDMLSIRVIKHALDATEREQIETLMKAKAIRAFEKYQETYHGDYGVKDVERFKELLNGQD